MPLVRIDMPAGKPAEYRSALARMVQTAMHDALGVPMAERFQIITEHQAANLSIDRNYLDVGRSADAMIIQVTLIEGRTAETKQAFYKALADGLEHALGLRREDVVVSLVEVGRADWSFGDGGAQLVRP